MKSTISIHHNRTFKISSVNVVQLMYHDNALFNSFMMDSRAVKILRCFHNVLNKMTLQPLNIMNIIKQEF